MSSTESRGAAGHLTEGPFAAHDLAESVAKRLTRDRYGWLTTVAQSGTPVPMLAWFRFDGATVTVYSQPHASRITHVFEHPEVSLHLESDGTGGNIVILGGRAAVTAEGVDPREDAQFWTKYHLEADASGLSDAIGSFSTRITITPTTLWTTHPT